MAEHEREQECRPESEKKRPLAEEEVPGVRGIPALVEEPASLPRPDLGTWGGEGGAGVYRGAPIISRAPELGPVEAPEAEPPPREPAEPPEAGQPPAP